LLFGLAAACFWSNHEQEVNASPLPTGSHFQWVRTFYTTADGLPSHQIRALTLDRDGAMLVADAKAVVRLEENRWISQSGPSNVTALFAPSREAEALAGAMDGVWVLHQGQWRKES